MPEKSNTQRIYEYLLDLPAGFRFQSRDLVGREGLEGLNTNQIAAALATIESRGAVRCANRSGRAGGGCSNNYEWTDEERHLQFGPKSNVKTRCREPGATRKKPVAPLVTRFDKLSDELLNLASIAEAHRRQQGHAGTSNRNTPSRAEALLACAERAEALEKRVAELEGKP